ncbi:MAG: hypothetical protein KDA78_00035 [Planctomycetaceae bacterium]|nr:hypothetical protein [Planctomycetaceae bacterium]
MHLTGKIFAFLTLCLAIAAVILTAKTLDRQTEWSKRVEKARTDYQSAQAQLPDAEALVTQLEEQLSRARLGWGRHWDDVEVVPGQNIARGIINVDIGRNDGIGQTTDQGDKYPLLYGFQKDAQGNWSYVGEFRVTAMEVNRAGLQLSRTPRTGETDSWNFSEKWRFRDALPAAKRQPVGDLLVKMTTLEQRLNDRRQFLQIQQKSVESAKASLEDRMKELNGNPEAPAEAGPEYTKGLVATLVEAEEKRNAALAEVQTLRETLRKLQLEFEQLVADNAALENSLRSKSKTALSAPSATN